MSLASLAVLLVAVALAAVAQLVLKHGMTLAQHRVEGSGGSLAIAAATSPWVVGGLAIFGVSAVAWMLTLSRVPLSLAYPFNARRLRRDPDRQRGIPARTHQRVDLVGHLSGGRRTRAGRDDDAQIVLTEG